MSETGQNGAVLLLVQLLDLYSLVVLGAVVISWIQLPPSNPIATFLHAMTEPLLAPIRRVLPDMGGLDFSPLVLLFGLRILRGLLLTAALGS
jgi:YggT family protein